MNKFSKHLPESWGLVLSAFASAYGIGLLSLLALPFLISAVINGFNVNEATAGYIVSAEFAFTMIASLIVAPFMATAPRRTIAIIGSVTAIAANIFSASAASVEVLTVFRCIAGIGAGLCLACGNACVSSAKNPDQVAGHMNVLFVGMMIVVMLVFADVMESNGLAGLYYTIAITMSVMLLLVLKMPQKANLTSEHHDTQHPVIDIKIFSGVGVLMLIAMFLFSARDTMGWAFVEQVGTKVGYDGPTLGLLFSLQAFIGLAGPLLASIIGKRFGIRLPVIIGIVATGLVTLGYVLGAESKMMYTIAVLINAAVYFYTLAYMTALAASLDKGGRVAAASGSFLTLGVAIGPSISGTLIAIGGYQLSAIAIAITALLTLLCVIAPLAKARERYSDMSESQVYKTASAN
ncbi:MFS transporter [Marinomonas sp.]|uniref:MFS transporter n=1 Tax=Marinomonas sp. TaxID=1904862 RepID=UPI003BA937ED